MHTTCFLSIRLGGQPAIVKVAVETTLANQPVWSGTLHFAHTPGLVGLSRVSPRTVRFPQSAVVRCLGQSPFGKAAPLVTEAPSACDWSTDETLAYLAGKGGH